MNLDAKSVISNEISVIEGQIRQLTDEIRDFFEKEYRKAILAIAMGQEYSNQELKTQLVKLFNERHELHNRYEKLVAAKKNKSEILPFGQSVVQIFLDVAKTYQADEKKL